MLQIRDRELAELEKRGVKTFALGAEAGKRFIAGASAAAAEGAEDVVDAEFSEVDENNKG